jgi:hypothetical protein
MTRPHNRPGVPVSFTVHRTQPTDGTEPREYISVEHVVCVMPRILRLNPGDKVTITRALVQEDSTLARGVPAAVTVGGFSDANEDD